jgi:fused signal recognition particle receptor
VIVDAVQSGAKRKVLMGILDRLGFSKLKDSLARTRDNLVGRVSRLVSSKTTIDDDLLEQLEEILITGDLGVATATEIIDSLRRRVKDEGFTDPSQLNAILKAEIRTRFGGESTGASDPFVLPATRPYVIMIVGINGVGKTTTIGKLAHAYVQTGKKVLIAAADTFRAAANEQLEIWAERAGASIIRQKHGSDPAAVAYDSVQAATARAADVVIVDTAGRLHTKVNLMEELRKIKRVLQKISAELPQEVLLVIDASTGQNGLQQAKQFAAAVGVTGIVLTKLDGTAKGGIVLSISRTLNVPVKFVGVGEKLGDLQPFDAEAFVEALFSSQDSTG